MQVIQTEKHWLPPYLLPVTTKGVFTRSNHRTTGSHVSGKASPSFRELSKYLYLSLQLFPNHMPHHSDSIKARAAIKNLHIPNVMNRKLFTRNILLSFLLPLFYPASSHTGQTLPSSTLSIWDPHQNWESQTQTLIAKVSNICKDLKSGNAAPPAGQTISMWSTHKKRKLNTLCINCVVFFSSALAC